jgi:DNA invertase Pin-like site-specific DNA recombinase
MLQTKQTGFPMADGKFITYLRVSTDRQGKSGLGIEAQRATVAGF